jgi:hypothetical protein
LTSLLDARCEQRDFQEVLSRVFFIHPSELCVFGTKTKALRKSLIWLKTLWTFNALESEVIFCRSKVVQWSFVRYFGATSGSLAIRQVFVIWNGENFELKRRNSLF